MKKVTKAVIPAAGLGTRVLPATKAMPKGMLPLVDKPAIQYLVEEAVRSGITDILIIVSRNQDIIQDHFDRSPELEAKLAAPGKEKMLEECLGISNLANIFFVRQQQTLGLGHAVSMAKPFTGDDPFVVIYGDDVIWGEDPVCAQLIRAYEEFGRPVAGVSAVPWADVSRYCSLKTTPIHDNYFFVDDMIEKPKKGQEFSNYSILGRVLLTPEIYDILARTKPGAGGEIQLTDAMAEYARNYGGMTAVEFTGKHYDMGNKLKVAEAQVELALQHPEIGEDILANPSIFTGAALASAAFAEIPVFGTPVLVLGMCAFAYSTILGWSYYGNRCVAYLFGPRGIKPYQVIYVAVAFFGAIGVGDVVWTVSDVGNALMAIPNIIVILLLSGMIARETRHYVYDGNLDEEYGEPVPRVKGSQL